MLAIFKKTSSNRSTTGRDGNGGAHWLSLPVTTFGWIQRRQGQLTEMAPADAIEGFQRRGGSGASAPDLMLESSANE